MLRNWFLLVIKNYKEVWKAEMGLQDSSELLLVLQRGLIKINTI
jgi:hypothetical protein